MGAEKATRSANKKKEGDGQPPSGDPAAMRGGFVARSGRAAVNETERRICGPGALRSAALAEGLALAGRRAATLLAREAPIEFTASGASSAWVHHRIVGSRDGASGRLSFQLVARDAQEAVDHCLVAQRMAARLRRPGICALEHEIADALHLVRLPDPEMIGGLLGRKELGPLPKRVTEVEILEAAAEAMETVSRKTGRPRTVVNSQVPADAECVVISGGANARMAERVAGRLRETGLSCGSVGLALVHPLPLDAMRRSYGGVRTIVILGVGKLIEPTGPVARLRALLNDGKTRVFAVAAGDRDVDPIAAEIATLLGIGPITAAPAAPATDPAPADRRFAFGVHPRSAWSDELLLDIAAELGRFGSGPWPGPTSAPEPRRWR